MPPADTAKTRTVGDIMSTPVIVAAPDDKVAEAAARMREQRVGSVVVVDDSRPVGILTERDLVRIAAAGADTGTATVRDWMTANPDSVAPDVEAAAAFASLSQHGYRHIPVVDHDEVVGIVSMRDLMRIAQIQPAENLAHEIPRGLEGVVVAETEIGDVRGLEGFYHYRQYNAVELAEKRSIEDVWHLMFEGELPTKAEAEAFRRRVAPLREIPAEVKRALPEVARLGRNAPPLDMLRTTVSLLGANLGFRPSLDIDDAELRTQALQVCAVGADPAHRDLPAAARPRADRSRPRARVRGELPVHAQRHGADARARARGRAVPDLDDRPRVQRVDVHGPGDHLDRRGPRGRGDGRDRRALRPAARWCTEPRARHARRDRVDRERGALAARRGRARRPADGLRPPGLQDRRPALGHAARRRRAARRRQGRAGQADRGQGDRGARGAEAGPQALHERRVLRRHRDGHGRGCPGRCSPRRSRRAG